MKRILSCTLTILAALCTFTACEKEEETAAALSGSWEGNMGITHIYKGQTLTPTRTVFTFNYEGKNHTRGDGYVVEYYNHPDIKQVYRHLSWETWTRQNGDVGVQIELECESVRYHIVDYKLGSKEFKGKYSTKENPEETPFTLTHVDNAPDVSQVKYWGYDELLPTWKPITYAGALDVRRMYEGVEYHPTQVTITFDIEPEFNNGMIGVDQAYVREDYADAPFGTFLADSLRSWSIYYGEMNLHFANSDNSWGDYQMFNVKATADSLVGEMLVDTNVFTHFNLPRTSTPDWSAIKQWGIVNRLK